MGMNRILIRVPYSTYIEVTPSMLAAILKCPMYETNGAYGDNRKYIPLSAEGLESICIEFVADTRFAERELNEVELETTSDTTNRRL
jgi:hypothetical protein